MKKYLLILTLVTLIIPSFAFASWWNPTTWSIFSFFHNNVQEQTVSTSTLPEIDLASTTIAKTSINQMVPTFTPPQKIIKKNVVKATPNVDVQAPVVQIQTPSPVQPSGTLCNGTYWSACPTGQNLICPQTGSAYCQVSQQQNVISNTNYQQTQAQATAQVTNLAQQIYSIKQNYVSEVNSLYQSVSSQLKQSPQTVATYGTGATNFQSAVNAWNDVGTQMKIQNNLNMIPYQEATYAENANYQINQLVTQIIQIESQYNLSLPVPSYNQIPIPQLPVVCNLQMSPILNQGTVTCQ